MRSGLTSTTLTLAMGRVLVAERLRLGWSQEALAEKAGLNRSYVSDLENGRRTPNLDTILRIAKAFKMRPSKLLSASEAHLDGRG